MSTAQPAAMFVVGFLIFVQMLYFVFSLVSTSKFIHCAFPPRSPKINAYHSIVFRMGPKPFTNASKPVD
jgi:hypothetical protein